MKPTHLRFATALIVAIVLAAAARHASRVLGVASAYYAKTLCSGVFVAGRDQDTVVREDLLPDMTREFGRFSGVVDRETGLVTSSLFGVIRRQALYRPGLGCTLLNGVTAETLRAQATAFTPAVAVINPAAAWPEGNAVDLTVVPEGVDRARLARAVDTAFSEPHENALRRTRAVVIVYGGKIIAERYAAGVGPDTPLLGWSMGKSIAGVLSGILAGEGRLDPDQKGLFDEWRGEGDDRAKISLDDLLRMTSGLDFDAPHAKMLSDVRKMLFVKGNAAAYAKARPMANAPGTSWTYGSGSTVLVSALHRRVLGDDQKLYFNYPRRALFAPLGMTSIVVEPDAAGTLLFPAFVYASARDWARFGQFVADDGVWQGRRLVPYGWIDYLTRPTAASDGEYAAHFWRRVPSFLRPTFAPMRRLPGDRFYMLGHDGQMVAIVPSRGLVVVRLGLSRRRGAWDPDELLADVLAALPAETE